MLRRQSLRRPSHSAKKGRCSRISLQRGALCRKNLGGSLRFSSRFRHQAQIELAIASLSEAISASCISLSLQKHTPFSCSIESQCMLSQRLEGGLAPASYELGASRTGKASRNSALCQLALSHNVWVLSVRASKMWESNGANGVWSGSASNT